MALSKTEMEKWVERSKPKTARKESRPESLQNGDRLTRSEFERRYKAMPHIKKAELIEGVVYIPSPVRFEQHAEPHGSIVGALVAYRAATPGVRVGDNTTIRLDIDNEPQPDIALLIDPQCGGQTRISEDGYLEGGPELIVEVAASSASYDLHDKLNAYRRNGVREYVVWRVEDGVMDWFRLEAETYVRITPDARGIIRSRAFPGLWLNIKAMLAGEIAKALADLQKGLKSKEHAAFVKQLAKTSRTRTKER
jgi:Uma2 family endonuclease